MFFISEQGGLKGKEKNIAESIYRNYGDLIYSVSYKILNNQFDAEDVLQTVMIKICRNIRSFTDLSPDSMKAMMIIYSRNAAYDLYRKRKNEILTIDDSDMEEECDVTFDIEETVITKEKMINVKEAFLSLKQSDKDIIFLRIIENQPSKTVAEMLCISENAVNLRLKRAKQKLIKKLGGKNDEQ